MGTGFFRQLFSKPDVRETFEAQYRAGEWSYLEDMAELPRYSIIAGYCRRMAAKAILDVGCGHGVLAANLKQLAYEHYLGIDFSVEAVRHACEAQADPRTHFAVANAASFLPERSFDAIIFNECLYYLEDPAKLMRAYAQALTPQGRFIVSIHRTPRNERTWRLIEKAFVVEDGVTLTNQAKTAWIVKVLTPRSTAH